MADPTSIYHWQRLDERFTTSGQPTETELAELVRLGVRTVINLALSDSPRALPDEAASVNALGMDYVHVPVDFADPTEADFASFCAAMAAAEGTKIHVHCAANYCVSAFSAVTGATCSASTRHRPALNWSGSGSLTPHGPRSLSGRPASQTMTEAGSSACSL